MTKNNFLRKERIFLLSSFLVLLIFSGCQKQPNLTFGSSYLPDNASANIVRVDTTTVLVSTVYTDSVASAATGFLQVGTLKDPWFGTINTRSFLQISPPATLPSLTSFDKYDSIKLIMLFKSRNPFYGDSTIHQNFVVNMVDTQYQLAGPNNGFWSTYKFPIKSTPLGTATAKIYPNVGWTDQGFLDTIKVNFPQALGQQLYNMIYNNSDTIRNIAKWYNWFPGICVSPNGNDNPASQGSIYGLRDSVIMRIYYHENSTYPSIKFIDFPFANKANQFNNITVNRLGTPMAALDTPQRKVIPPPATPSGAMANAGYISSMLGLGVKLTFPYLNNIALKNDFLSVVRAELSVQPVQGTFNTSWYLPSQIACYVTDLHNIPITIIPGAAGPQYGGLVPNYLNPLGMVYSYDVTPFIKTQILATGPTATQNGVMLEIPPAQGGLNSFVRTVITDGTFPVNKRVTLSVYYISLFPHN